MTRIVFRSSRPDTAQRGAFTASASALGACALAGAITDVVCVVGVIGNFGTAPLLALWVIDAAIVMGFAGVIAGFVDRVNRARALVLLLGVTSVLHLGVAGLFFADVRPELSFGALLALGRIDANLAVTFAWALARDHFDFDAAVGSFSRLNVIAVAAGSVGALTATMIATPSARTMAVTGIGLSFALAAVIVGKLAPREPTRRAVEGSHERMSLPPRADAGAAFSIPPPLRVRTLAPPPLIIDAKPVTHVEAVRFVFANRAFRAVAWFGIINGSAHSVIAYEVLRAFEQSGEGLAAQYGALRFAEPVALAVVQAVIAPTFMRRAGVRGAFVAPSVAIVVAVVLLAISHRPSAAIASAIITNVAFGLEYAGFAASLTEIPERLRPRTSVLLDGTVYHVGYIAGVALLVASGSIAMLIGKGDVARTIALGATFLFNLAGLRLALRFSPRFGAAGR